ncbi:acetate--CoA ligase family protein [Paracoccus sp. MBLB3053]|uniref:Acetate--CoA ligase family protein n=1 Tax=Paracoccus aurantius TaxID=3073814 RepID=A0ABU2HW92_9RHOB|nr:acetate--CoA ligase family protein [Paracoccus sp. MBLB3053]MDS9469317.1 acetate--CoA ligase family protein [Paracoccus sp. MBLB3053]
MESLLRLFSPQAITVVGGGAWCEAVVQRCIASGFTGPIWPVHPNKPAIGGVPAFPSLAALPGVPDAAFVGVNRELSIEVCAELSAMGCGGAVCFAAGFREASAELSDGAELQQRLVEAAGDMRILGPNCYGFVNMLDGVSLWPDVHGLSPVERGVAVVGQSSNVLINLTMQRRGLPLACVVAAGNQAQSSMAEIGMALLDDPRITALGLHIEGLTDLPAFEALARLAARRGKPVVALKVGRSEQAMAAAISHTASLAGSDAGARALFERLGIAQVDSPAELIETLKILHVTRGLSDARIVSASCSGGEASIIADLGKIIGIEFPALNQSQRDGLRAALGPKVALANPLDYNTYIWGDAAALTATFTALMAGEQGLGCVVLDYPRPESFEAPSWDMAVDAVIAASRASGKPMAIISLLAENMPEAVARRLMEAGVIPLCGMWDAVRAIRAAAGIGKAASAPILLPGVPAAKARMIGEAEAKGLLSAAGVPVPRALRAGCADEAAELATKIGFPVVLKGEGIAHKTEAGAVALNLSDAEAVRIAALAMPTSSFLVEEMVTGAVAELLIGVLRDPAHGFVLTLGPGGVLTELIHDSASMLIPASREDVRSALDRLRIAPMLRGYRGKPAAALDTVVDAVMAVQDYVVAHAAHLEELEINPLICTTAGVIAADALFRIGEQQ